MEVIMGQLVLKSNDQDLVTKVQLFAQSLGLTFEVQPENVVNFPSPQKKEELKSISQVESEAISNAVISCKGNLSEVAKTLGIGRATLYRKLKEYNIDPKQLKKVA